MKRDQLAIRLSGCEEAILRNAATIRGKPMMTMVREAALAEARRVIDRHERKALRERGK